MAFLLANNFLLNYFPGCLLMADLDDRKQYLILLTSSLFTVNLTEETNLTGGSFTI